MRGRWSNSRWDGGLFRRLRIGYFLLVLFVMPNLLLVSVSGEAAAEPGQHVQQAVAGPVPGPATGPTIADYLASTKPEILRNREDLGKFNSWMLELAPAYNEGFVIAENSGETRAVTQLWAGSSPLQAVVRKEAESRGINLIIRAVKYSRAVIDASMAKIEQSRTSTGWNGFIVDVIAGTDMDHDGIELRGHYSDGRTQLVAQTTDFAASISPVVVNTKVAPAPVPLSTRSTDSGTFFAGGMMRAYGSYDHCSSGFGVVVPWYGGGAQRTMTARHCTASQYTAWDLPSSNYGINVTTTQSGGKLLSGYGSFYTFDGAWNDPNGFKKKVIGYFDAAVGDNVCSSGAMSGVHCFLKVRNTYIREWDGFGYIGVIYAVATQQPFYAGAPGDSGGPVMVPFSNQNYTTVGASGMIQAGVDLRQSPCGPGTRDPNQSCFSSIYFSPTRSIVNDLGGGTYLYTSP